MKSDNGDGENETLISVDDESNCDRVSEIDKIRNRLRFRKRIMNWLGSKLLAPLLALCLPILIPAVPLYVFTYLYRDTKKEVDRENCTCSCWDGIFKGPYESGTPRYKHVYFNSTRNTLHLWVITVLGVVLLYEVFKHVFALLFTRHLRWSMALLLLSSLHSHYYAWWNHWNFWNDDFYMMWYHQLFFTLSELISSCVILPYLDRRRGVEPAPMLVVSTIAVFHAFCSGLDQFLENVLQVQGQWHQVLRDLLLMSTDILHVTVSICAVRSYAVRNRVSLFSLLIRRTHLAVIFGVVVVLRVCLLVAPKIEH